MSECDLRPTAVGWALHALEPDDERRMADHLPHCPTCRRTLHETEEVLALLAVGVPVVDPPAGLRERILLRAEGSAAVPDRSVQDAVDELLRDPVAEALRDAARGPVGSRPVDPAVPDPALSDPSEPDPSEPDPSEPDPVVPDQGRRDPGTQDPGPGPTSAPAPVPAAPGVRRWALLTVAAVVLGVVLLSVRALVPTLSPTPSSVAERADQVVAQARAVDPQARHATLQGADGAPVAVVLADAGSTRLVPLALPPTGDDRDYVLWRTGDATPVAVAVIDETGDTQAVRPPSAPSSSPGTAASAGSGFAVSIEPVGAVPERPSDVVAEGRIT